MKKTRCKTMILTVLAVLVISGIVLATPGGYRHRRGVGGGHHRRRGPAGPAWQGEHGRPMMLERILHKLDLTDEQAEQVKTIREGNKEKMKAARKAVAEATKALHETTFQDANEATIRAAATVLGKALGDKAVLQATRIASIKKVLTGEQLMKLKESRAEMKEWAGQFRERMRDPKSCNRFWQRRGPKSRPRRRLNIEKLFETKDTNKDEKLTKEELQAGDKEERPRRLARFFDKADTDEDGALTTEELKAFKEKMKDRPRWRRGRPHWR
jgi:Spy/CpxP family protein refolding chaperone